MRRFQNILYVTRGTEDETDSLKQALSLARNNATQLHVLIVSPVLPKSLGEYEAVAVAVDPQSTEPAGWDLALQLLGLSRSLADTCSGELSIVSCWDYELENYLRHSAWGRVPEEIIDSGVITAEREHRAALQALIHESGIAGQVRVHHVRARAGEAIPRFVEDSSIDILVMGTVARTGIPGFVIGNTAENALRGLQCSLLALKPNGFVSQVRAY